MYRNGANRLVPAVYGQTDKGWYGEMRYNYEEAQTVSLLAGKTFARGGSFAWSVMPQAGLLAGRFNGASAGFQAEAKAGIVTAFIEPQYCASFGSAQSSFFYNWAELSLHPVRNFYAGIALQQTATHKERFIAEPGFVLGLNAGKLELPVYYFKQKNSDGYLVVGMHWKLER